MASRVKNCLHCGAEMSRKPKMSDKAWADQKYCSKACRSAVRTLVTAPKTCEQCGKKYTRKIGTALKVFEKSRFCSTTCAGESLRTKPRKHCEHCRKALKPHPDERPNDFESRRFCDVTCANRFKKAMRHKEPTEKEDKLYHVAFNPLITKPQFKFPHSSEGINGYRASNDDRRRTLVSLEEDTKAAA